LSVSCACVGHCTNIPYDLSSVMHASGQDKWQWGGLEGGRKEEKGISVEDARWTRKQFSFNMCIVLFQLQMYEASSFSLTILLESCVDQRYPAFSSCFSVVVDNNLHYAKSVQDAINSITLRYAVSIPLPVVVSLFVHKIVCGP